MGVKDPVILKNTRQILQNLWIWPKEGRSKQYYLFFTLGLMVTIPMYVGSIYHMTEFLKGNIYIPFFFTPNLRF